MNILWLNSIMFTNKNSFLILDSGRSAKRCFLDSERSQKSIDFTIIG